VRRVYEGMMIAIPPVQWQPVAQLDLASTVQFLQQLAAQMELSKFRSHPRGEKKKVPKPKWQKDKPHVSTARLLNESKSKKGNKAP
jgi:hypothetical protein